MNMCTSQGFIVFSPYGDSKCFVRKSNDGAESMLDMAWLALLTQGRSFGNGQNRQMFVSSCTTAINLHDTLLPIENFSVPNQSDAAYCNLHTCAAASPTHIERYPDLSAPSFYCGTEHAFGYR